MLKIIKDNNKLLRERCKPVEMPLSNEDKSLLFEMLDYLKKSQDEDYVNKHHIRSGVGLAAPQVGVSKRMLVVYIDYGETQTSYILINPKIVSSSIKQCYINSGEGCLSVDVDKKGYVYRPYKVKIKAYDLLQEKDIEITAKGYESVVLQHEIDHLNGVLYYDHIDKTNPYKKIDNSIEL